MSEVVKNFIGTGNFSGSLSTQRQLLKDYEENKRFQITKIARNARNRDYVGCVDWLGDTGLLVASLDDEAQDDLRVNHNLGTYKGAIYENIVGDMLVKQGYDLYYYKSDKPALVMKFTMVAVCQHSMFKAGS